MKPSNILCATLVSLTALNYLSCKHLEEGNSANTIITEGRNNLSAEVIVVPKVPLTPKEYVAWIQQNLFEAQNNGGISFQLQYKPYDYIACLEIGSGSITDTERNAIVDEVNGLQYFDLRMVLNSQSGELLKYQLQDTDDYQLRVKYYAFDFLKDISLISASGDTVHPVLFHFERAYDLTSFCTFSLAFPKEGIDYSKDFTIDIFDREFSGHAILFHFPASKLHQLPKLKTI